MENLQHVNVSLLLAGIGSFIMFYFLRGYVWHRLLKAYSYHHIPFKESCFLWATSELKRYIPGNIWSFLGRSVLFSEKQVKKKDIATCLILEAEIFVISAAIVSLFSLPFLTQSALVSIPFWIQSLLIWSIEIGTLVYIFHKVITRHLHHPHLTKIAGFIFPSYSAGESILLLIISSVALLFFGLGSYLTVVSFIFIDPNLVFALSSFFVLSLLLGYLSLLTPAGFGVREGIVIAGLGKLMPLSAAAFASLFSRIILIVAELVFILLVWMWHTTKNSLILRSEKWIANNKQAAIIIFLIGLYTTYFSAISILRYDHFYTGKFDLGNMAQTVWNTSQGRIFEITDPNGTATVSRLAFHADFLLVLLAPFYWIWSDPRMLLIIQTVVVACGAYFVFLIAKDVIKNKNIAFVLAFAYLINPSVERANIYDFHSVTLATTFLLATYYFLRKKQYVGFGIFALLAAISKEQVWVIIALFGILVFFWHKKRVLGTSIFIFSLAMFYFFVSYAIPHSLGSNHFALSYYAEFGDSPADVIKAMIFSPDKVLQLVLQESRLEYLHQLFSPLGYLPVLTPWFLIFAGPDFAINLLSNNAQLHQIYYQYTATITPFLFLGAIYGIRYIQLWKPSFLKKRPYMLPSAVITYVVIMSVHAAYQYGPLPGSMAPNLDMITKPVSDKTFIDSYISQIPQNYSIAASNNIGSHLSHRKHIYILPLGKGKADMIIFLLTNSESPRSLESLNQFVQEMKEDQNYVIDVQREKFVVFKKKNLQ